MAGSASGHVYWITGLSGSGKTTLGRALCERLRRRDGPAVLLDGDAVRELLPDGGGHDRESRKRIARFNGRLCLLLASQGIDVVCPTISLFHECQDWNRANIPAYVEIYLRASLEDLRKRDVKQIYARAARGELRDVVGVDIPPEYPRAPDHVFDVSTRLTVEEMIARVLPDRATGTRK